MVQNGLLYSLVLMKKNEQNDLVQDDSCCLDYLNQIIKGNESWLEVRKANRYCRNGLKVWLVLITFDTFNAFPIHPLQNRVKIRNWDLEFHYNPTTWNHLSPGQSNFGSYKKSLQWTFILFFFFNKKPMQILKTYADTKKLKGK